LAHSEANRPLIVFVDHDADSINEIISSISGLKRTQTTMEKLGDLFRFKSIVIDPKDASADRVFEEIQNIRQTTDLVLVDLNFGAHEDSEGVFIGRVIAAELARKHHKLTVGVFSKFPTTWYQRAMISSDRFALVLDDLRDKLAEGPGRVPADHWYNIFDRAIQEAHLQKYTLPPLLTETYGRGITKWAAGHPQHRSFSFTKAACNLVDLALDGLDPAPSEIVITQIGGGFSGSFVVKATTPDQQKPYIVKIDEDPARLDMEIKGYRRIQTTIPHKHYLPLLNLSREQPVKLATNWWGAIAMEHEGQAKPLIEHQGIQDKDLANIYRRIWNECLSDLYGPVSKQDIPISSVVSSEMVASANGNWNAMRRYHNWINTFQTQQRSVIEQFNGLLNRTLNIPFTSDAVIQIPWIESVHGDLNCRNILYNADDKSFYLIDFPRISPDCLALDFVKAESELVLIMMDWTTGLDQDFKRIEVWDRLIETISSSFELRDMVMEDSESNRVLTSVKTIREIYDSMHQNNGQPRLAYQLYLIATVLPYIGYSDITIFKKLLAALWVGRLAKTKWAR